MKIFGYVHHMGHTYELCKLPAQFYFEGSSSMWSLRRRPMLPNIVFMGKNYDAKDCDVAILHLDSHEAVVHAYGWYRKLNERIQHIPKIVILHGPPYRGGYDQKVVLKTIRELVGDNAFVVNSNKVRERWGWGETIIHGMDPNEWYTGVPKVNRILSSIQGSFTEPESGDILTKIQLRPEVNKHIKFLKNQVDCKNFDDYRKALAESLVYFTAYGINPMPRTRAEAMFSEVCVVTTGVDDEPSFIENGVNGFIIHNVDEAEKVLLDLVAHPEKAIEIGKRARQTAIEKFHINRFLDDWKKLITRTLGEDRW